MIGEQHERAVEAVAAAFCPRQNGACRSCRERAHRAFAEQGVRLVDLREVVEFVRDQGEEDEHGYRDHFDPDDLADAIERRFGGNERKQ